MGGNDVRVAAQLLLVFSKRDLVAHTGFEPDHPVTGDDSDPPQKPLIPDT
jgi:hypothetical protein